MTWLLQLERGDLDELEGRVIIYSMYDQPESDAEQEGAEEVIAMFFSTHPADFADKLGMPEGGLAEMAEKEAQQRAEHEAGSLGVAPLYGAPIQLEASDIKIASEDVVFSGRFSDVKKCRTSVQIAAQLYVLRYSEQLLVRSGMGSGPGAEASGTEQANYGDIPSEEMRDHLQARYIAPIMHALEDDNCGEAIGVAQDFVRFCGDHGPLTDDAYALAAAVRAAPGTHTTPLIHAYCEKLLAVVDERFEEAARLRDQIRTMRTRPPGAEGRTEPPAGA